MLLFDIFVVRLKKLLNKKVKCRWVQTPWGSSDATSLCSKNRNKRTRNTVILMKCQWYSSAPISFEHYTATTTVIYPTNTSNYVNKTPVKSYISSGTLSLRLRKPVAYTETTCVPGLSIELAAWNDISLWKYDILRNGYKMSQSFTRILFNLLWWQVSNIDSYNIFTKGSLCLTVVSDNR